MRLMVMQHSFGSRIERARRQTGSEHSTRRFQPPVVETIRSVLVSITHNPFAARLSSCPLGGLRDSAGDVRIHPTVSISAQPTPFVERLVSHRD